jgi:hypothetical protein
MAQLAVREAGLAPAPRARWTREAIVAAIREWTAWYGWPPERTVRLGFGSLSATLEAVAQAPLAS